MKLVTKLQIFGIFAVSLVIMLGFISYWRITEVNKALERNTIATEMVKQTFILTLLSDDYLLSHSERAEVQWRQQHTNLNNIINSYSAKTAQEQKLIGQLKQGQERLRIHFSQIQDYLKKPIDANQTFERRLAGQLSIDMQRIVTLTSSLAEINNTQLAEVRTLTSVALLVVSIFLILLLFFTYVIFARSISSAITKLEHGTKTLAAGDLDFRVDIRSKDEFGSLADSFNTMASQLHTSYQTLASEKIKDEAILGSIGDGIIATDQDGIIILVNQQGEEILGWKEKEILGKALIETLTIEDEQGNIIPPEKRPMRIVRTTGKKVTTSTKNTPYYYKRRDGSRFPVAITVTPIILHKKMIGAIEVFRDITFEKELDKAKDEFITLASHELRTPLSIIKGLIAMILKEDYGKVSDTLKAPLTNIKVSTDRETELINNLLNVSRLQTGKIVYEMGNIALGPIVEDVIHSLEPLAKQKRIVLTTMPFEHIVYADSNWVRHILNNLLTNAIKFTHKGTVSLSYSQSKDHIWVIISDTGIGIKKEDQTRLFKKFQQISSPDIGKPAGSGLGLYISREIARKMGGDIWIKHSKLNSGSTFIFSIPKQHSLPQ